MPENKRLFQGDSCGNHDHPAYTFYLRFIGKILTTVSHEFNNHLATLKESAGLADDILHARHLADKVKFEELSKLMQSVANKIQQTVLIVGSMSYFGGNLGHASVEFDVNILMDELLTLASKIASPKLITVGRNYDRTIPRITNDPFLVQFLVFALLDNLISCHEGNSPVTITTDHTRSSVIIGIVSEREPSESAQEALWPSAVLHAVAHQIGGVIESKRGGAEIMLALPVR